MVFSYPHWQRVKEHLSSIGSAPSTLLNLTALCVNLSPLPPDVEKIKMDGPFFPQQFMENIVRNFLLQSVALRYSTWENMKTIYEMVEADSTPSNQKLLEILLIVSKVSTEEYFDGYYKFSHKDHPGASANSFYDKMLLSSVTLPTLKLIAMQQAETIQPVKQDVLLAIKGFLLRPAIMAALQTALEKVNIQKGVEWITTMVNSMNISYMKGDPGFSFNGFAMRDGILLITDENVFKAILTDHAANMFLAKYKAALLTTACHETCHYLARSAENDFNYSSPGKGPVPLMDDTVPGKRLELGRYVELLIFGNIQPHWQRSSIQAALDFLERVNSEISYPLICKKPMDEEYLRERVVPSMSMAADLEDIDFGSIT